MDDKLYCPIPWHSAAVRTNGDYRVCCHTNVIDGGGLLLNDGVPISMGRVSVDQIRNNVLLKNIRKNFLNGQWSDTCAKCRISEEHGQRSGRIHAVTRLSDLGIEADFRKSMIQKTNDDGSINITDFSIQEMDLRFGNFCNLSCRTCGPTDSSGWHSDWIKLGHNGYYDNGQYVRLEKTTDGKVFSPDRPTAWSENVDFYTVLPTELGSLRHIYFAGGEPLINKDHHRLLEFLIKAGLGKQINLEYNTNLSVFSEKIISLWSSFKSVGVGISMDGFGAYHDYIRHPLKFERIEKNLSALDLANVTLRGWLACTVSWMNLAHLPDFIFWKQAKGYKRINNELSRAPISFHLLHQPMNLNLKSIPKLAKKYIESRVLLGIAEMRRLKIYPDKKLDSTEKILLGMVSYMKSEDLSMNWRELWLAHLELDKIRGKDYSLVDPELFSILNK